MALTTIRFEAVGDHIEVKIGAHCRAQLTALEENLLLDWLTDRDIERSAKARPPGVNPTLRYLDLPARNGV